MTARTPAAQLLEAWDAAHEAERSALAALLAALTTEPAPDRELLTITEAAARLGIARSTASRWADTGRLLTVGPPHARRVPAAELDRLSTK